MSFSLPAFAQLEAIKTEDIVTQLDIYNHLYYYEDNDLNTTINELIKDTRHYFSTINSTHSLGYRHSVIWLHNSISNSSKQDISLFLLNRGSVNFIDLYLVKNGQIVVHQRHGSRIDYDQPEYPYRDPLFLLNIAKNTQYDLYLKYQTKTSYLITPTLLTQKHFASTRENSAYFYGAYFGILIAIFIYIFASALISKQKVLAYYSTFLGGTIFINHSMINFSSSVFGFTHSPSFIIAVSCIGSFLIITFFEFCFTLFDLKSVSPWFVKVIRRYFYAFVVLCILLLLFADLVIATQAYFLAMLLTIVFGVTFLILIIKHKLPYSTLFSIAWLSYYISLTVLTLAWTGIIDYSPSYLIYMYVATMIETIIFSFILALRYQRVHRISDSKTELLATAGHDIRQPLQAMLLYKDALENEVTTEKGHTLLNSLKRSINALHQLLNKLLDVSNIETGQVKINRNHFEISDMVEEIAEGLRSVADDKNLVLKTKIKAQLIFSDSVLLATIIRNILANALRYVDEGKVLITGRKKQNIYLIQIWDTGKGIDASKLQNIFDPYYQMDRYKKNEGIGLGLFICKQFANKLNIKIDVQSTTMKGTVFSLSIKDDV